MTITVITPAPDFDLTTLARVKSRLRIMHNLKDTQLGVMITSVSKSISRKLCRQFARETVTETVPGYGNTQLMLTRSPLISITAILFESTPVVDYVIKNVEESILYRRNGWVDTTVHGFTGIGFNPIPNSEEALYSVTYEAGYVLPNWMTPPERDLPEDIEDLVLDYIHFLYVHRSQKDVSIRSYRVGDISVGKSTSAAVVAFLSDFNRRCLEYKRIA